MWKFVVKSKRNYSLERRLNCNTFISLTNRLKITFLKKFIYLYIPYTTWAILSGSSFP